MLTACSWSSLSSTGSVDYRSGGMQTTPLDIPPDLSKLDPSRYQPPKGIVSAAELLANGSTTNETILIKKADGTESVQIADNTPNKIAIRTTELVRIQREGTQRWLATALPAEKVWNIVREFWTDQGFSLDVDQPSLGVMETKWSENRAKLPKDALSNALGTLLNKLFDSGERDRYRTRVERTAQGTDIFISHRGIAEVQTNGPTSSGTTIWQTRPNDPSLEAEMLARLMLKLSGQVETEKTVKLAVETVNSTTAALPRARMLEGALTAVQVDEDYEKAWRRVGLALDRGGFTVEDRDRTQGLYYVRYVDPAKVGKGEPGLIARLFGAKSSTIEQLRYRVQLKSVGDDTQITVLNNLGQNDNSKVAQQIARLLVDELK